MSYQIASQLNSDVDIVIISVVDLQHVAEPALVPAPLLAEVETLIDQQRLQLKLGQVQVLYRNTAPHKVMLVGVGERASLNRLAWQKAATAVGAALVGSHQPSVAWLLDSTQQSAHFVRVLVIAMNDAHYQQGQLKKEVAPPMIWPQCITLVGCWTEDAALGLQQGQAIAKGIHLTKTLGDLPGNHCTPSILAAKAQALADSSQGRLQVEILDEHQIKALGMGSFLAVSQGSAEPPRFIVFKYSGGVEHQAPIVLVGKGVTFDTGGISLKSPAHMDEMKYDMCGAASVFGVMQALIELQSAVHVCGLIVATENMPGSRAVKPGDVVTSMSGLTVEVLNTDAEGRLILADALTYAERFSPKAVIDIATLTGAMIVTLGAVASGLMANNQTLADELLKAGEIAADRLWQLPLWDEYQELIDTPFADVANLGGDGAKSITAACFLARFAKAYPWAHLDIAGTAWVSGKQRIATGRPVATLVEYLLSSSS